MNDDLELPETELTKALSPQRREFVRHYVETMNATEAARRANYKHANVVGPRLTKDPAVKAAITEAVADAVITSGIDGAWLLREMVDALQIAKTTLTPQLSTKTGKPVLDKETGQPIFKRNEAAVAKYLELLAKTLQLWKAETVVVSEQTASEANSRLDAIKAAVLANRGKPLVVSSNE